MQIHHPVSFCAFFFNLAFVIKNFSFKCVKCNAIQGSRYTHIFVFESGQNFDFPQRSLTVGLVLEGGNFLDGHFDIRHGVHCGAVIEGKKRGRNKFEVRNSGQLGVNYGNTRWLMPMDIATTDK